jgi:predicted kinase
VEAILLIGIQASGKSTFCKENLFDTHVRINLDMLRTRHRERSLIEACHQSKQPYVIDNTNPTCDARVGYLQAAKAAGFRTVGYYFASRVDECIERNSQRPTRQVIPIPGLLGTYNKLQIPIRGEGFDQLFYVSIDSEGKFITCEWIDEV